MAFSTFTYFSKSLSAMTVKSLSNRYCKCSLKSASGVLAKGCAISLLNENTLSKWKHDDGRDLLTWKLKDGVLETVSEFWNMEKNRKEGYKSSTITTKDGNFYAGSIVFEHPFRIIIKTSSGEEITIQKSNIKSRQTSKVSMMSAGLTDSLNERELIDLLKYIAELGKSQ